MQRCVRQCTSFCLVDTSGSAADNAAVSVWFQVSMKRCFRQCSSLCLVACDNEEMQQAILVPGVNEEMQQSIQQSLSGSRCQ